MSQHMKPIERGRSIDLRNQPADRSSTGIVHDLGNLIQVALSGLNRLARDPNVASAPGLDSLVASSRLALQSAGSLVRETIGRAEESREPAETADVGLCLSEIEMLIGCAWDRTVRLDVRAASDLPPARCDHLGLQNALLNLVFNARDAMPDGGVIAIDAAVAARHGSPLIEIRVKDVGIGMTEETMQRAFEPFFTTKGKGLGGVGLPMVRRFVDEHGGSVAVESMFGAGTTFTLRLPVLPLAPFRSFPG